VWQASLLIGWSERRGSGILRIDPDCVGRGCANGTLKVELVRAVVHSLVRNCNHSTEAEQST
jgi:hypothetical protein